MIVRGRHYRTVWMSAGAVRLIDQQRLPHRFSVRTLRSHAETAEAIRSMAVRGAGAIGAAAGFAMAQAAREALTQRDYALYMEGAASTVRATRPTAQNLFYAVERVLSATMRAHDSSGARAAAVAAAKEAQAVADEDAEACRAIGAHGEPLIRSGMRILTHCNAGWLAFVDWGSALSPVYAAKRAGKKVFVFADETRPRCQGAQLTSWELLNEGVEHAVIADNAAGHLISRGEVDMAIVGSDRIAANGDVANKIGTYEKALLCHEHGVPFYVAAPTSTIDAACASGASIPIEERSEDEVLCCWGLSSRGKLERVRIAPKGARARNPAFDVTPARLITAIITERGIVKPADVASLRT